MVYATDPLYPVDIMGFSERIARPTEDVGILHASISPLGRPVALKI
jgi:hypothetical protein